MDAGRAGASPAPTPEKIPFSPLVPPLPSEGEGRLEGNRGWGLSIETFTGFQIAVYPAGATFGPRRLNDYEFVWMLEGDAEYRWNERRMDAPEGSVLLCRPPATDAFRWDARRRTRHAFFHFRWRGELPKPGLLPPLGP